MSSKVITEILSMGMPFGEDNVDTDVIIPSRYLKTLTWEEVGEGLFYPRRFDQAKQPLSTVFNDPQYRGARILFAGGNFGCGSSREHAPQAIKAHYDAVVAVSFAGIFDGNCYAIGLPAVRVSKDHLVQLLERARVAPLTHFTLNLKSKQVSYAGETLPFEISDVNRQGFLTGTWDERDKLVANLPRTRTIAEQLPYVTGF